MDFENVKKVAVHNGVFHADDVLCVALLEHFLERDVTVIRNRKEDVLAEADIICDVGHGEFDHHQEDSEKYPNGIKMAACGKVARALASAGYITVDELELLKVKALYAVEGLDNGQKDETDPYPNPFSFVSVINNTDDEGGIYGTAQDAKFAQAVEMAKIVLERIMVTIKEEIENASLLEDYIYRRENPHYVIMEDKYIRSWQNRIIDYNDKVEENERIMIVMYPSGQPNEWRIQVVPKASNSFESWIKIPEKVAALDGFVFRHAAAFIAGFTNKDSAIEAMKMSIEE
jgi:uncharacterized UPF0160 family protein